MINRSQTTKPMELNIAGSSTFGRYPTISVEKTFNMFISDQWLVDYAGYQIAIPASQLGRNGATAIEGRGAHTSTKFNRIVAVFDNNVFLINIVFDQERQTVSHAAPTLIGQLQTRTGVVWITENNRPQIVISDNSQIYYYDPTLSPTFNIAKRDATHPINFIPGRVDFHDTYILCAASNDQHYTPPANNSWRLGQFNDSGLLVFPDQPANIGLIETKPDNTQAVIRVPSKGNMILVFGEVVTEAWFDVGAQLFPYQRNNQFNIDYGCVNPATIAANDEMVVWLAQNEKSGPIIMYTNGGMPQKITTDGIDYLFSQLTAPEDSEAFMYRQDGHVFYHINFLTDNLSLFYDFNTDKFYHACDENYNYFIASQVVFFNNQYYFISKNNGNLYVFDTVFSTYDGAEVPRVRICKNIRNVQQEYFIANDCGFTIETGNTNYQEQDLGPLYFITEDGNKLITEGEPIFFVTEDGDYLVDEEGDHLVSEQEDEDTFFYLISEQNDIQHTTPRVDLSISIDGGDHFSSYASQHLPPIGQRKFKLAWWQLGAANDLVCQFRFWGLGRFVATDGVVNIRQ